MKKSFILFIIFFIGLLSIISFFIVLNFFDPYSNKILALFLIIFSFIFGFGSFLTLILYFIKKIHYRGQVEIYHIKTSFRQALFVCLYIIGMIILNYIKAPLFILGFLLLIILIFIELFLQNID